MSNKKYHYFAVTKSNALLAKLLSKHNSEKFCLNYFNNFKTDGLFKKHKLFCKRDKTLSEKFKTVLNNATGELEDLPAKILKHQPLK